MISTSGQIYVVNETVKNGIKHRHQYQLVFHGTELKLHTYEWSVKVKSNPYQDGHWTTLVFVAQSYLNRKPRDDLFMNEEKFVKIRWNHIGSLSDVKVPKEVMAIARKRLSSMKP